MRKVWTIAITEYFNAVRSKAFIIGILMLPLISVGGFVVGGLARNKVDLHSRKVAVIDESGWLGQRIRSRAEERNKKEIFDSSHSEKQVRPRYLVEEVLSSSNRSDDEVQLSQRVRQRELFAFLVIRSNVVTTDAINPVSYFTETASYNDLPNWLSSVINDEVAEKRFEQAELDRQRIKKLLKPLVVKNLGLTERDNTGKVSQAKETNRMATVLVPVASMMMMFMLIMSAAPALLNSVLEEKMQKIAEVLVSSVTPLQLMSGKLIGTLLVSLTLSGLYLGTAALFVVQLSLTGYINLSLLGWFVLFQFLGLLIFGSIFIAIGSACNELHDAQSLMSPAMMILVLPMLCIGPVLESPTSTFSRAISLFPPATPMLMTLRIASKPGPPIWEILLGAILCAAFTLACLYAAAKIFRIGLLSQGQAPTMGTLMRWVVSK